jgi:pyruvate,water dikinase
MAQHPIQTTKQRSDRVDERIEDFLTRFDSEKREEINELIDLARASYQLRDDDNIYLGRLKGQLQRAQEEARRRLNMREALSSTVIPAEHLTTALLDLNYQPPKPTVHDAEADTPRIKARQLIGQPASPGIISGVARVIQETREVFDFEAGEILVCDAIDPNMTFVVPLSVGIVERRGGMLIHGAIIAREYGLPCVTGVPDATTLIQNGDRITVDGFLGIVILD